MVVRVTAVPAERGEYGALVGPRTGLWTGGFDVVEERDRAGVCTHQPYAGVGIDPMFVGNLFQGKGLKGIRVQVGGDVLVAAQQQDVGV